MGIQCCNSQPQNGATSSGLGQRKQSCNSRMPTTRHSSWIQATNSMQTKVKLAKPFVRKISFTTLVPSATQSLGDVFLTRHLLEDLLSSSGLSLAVESLRA